MREWAAFLNIQERELGPETVKKWLRPLKIINFDACNLYLQAPDSFSTVWFEEQVRKLVETSLFNKNGRRIRVHLSIANQRSERPKPVKPKEEVAFSLPFDEPSSDATLDTFVTFPGNELASKLIEQLASEELATFNPIYLYGPSGSGKTHLLMGAAHRLRAKGLKVICVRAEQFTEHVISAIRAGEMQLFRNIYRKADILMIDNVQILARKAATQEELHHTFNTLHVERKQMIFAANGAPQELRFIEPRLISRFEWGVVVPLELPDPLILTNILERRSKTLNLPLSDEIIPYLLKTFQGASAIRALEALALRIHLEKHPLSPDRPLTLPLAQTHLTDLIEEEHRVSLTPEKILDEVSAHFGIKSEDILGKSQKKEVSLPRQISMYLCRKRLALPYLKIGDLFSRDHSTVMTSVRRIEKELIRPDSEIAPQVNVISRQLLSS